MNLNFLQRSEERMKILRAVYDNLGSPKEINTADSDGEFILNSAQPQRSSMKCEMITINNIRELKMVTGVPAKTVKENINWCYKRL